MTDLSAKLDASQKEIVLLSIVNAMGGQTDAGDERWSWLQWFCADEVGSEADTFNRCIDKGWLKSSHDSDTDHSVAWITDEGRQALAQQALRTTEAGEVVAWRDVLAERQRQIATEGWTPDHDDEHDKGELAKAAGVYALAAASHDYRYALQGLPVNDYLAATFKMWPWHWGWFKPKDRRRDCVKAAALLLAEIERLDRAALSALEHQP